ncbi:MAG: hypothetical protein QXW70_03140 [Candidatus Anstonellales archaeon]
MPAIEVGRECIITRGRESGKRCKIIKLLNQNFVQIHVEGSKKERRISIRHLEPLP